MKLLVFAHTPPPHHGQSYMVKLMLEGFGGDRRKRAHADHAGTALAPAAQDIECYHVNARVSRDLEDIGNLRFGKLLLVLGYCLQAIWCRFRYGVKNFYYIPAPGKRSALYRDWIVLLICRPFFKHLILHWHAAGLAKWLETSVQIRARSITFQAIKHTDLSIILSDFNRADADKVFPRAVRQIANGIPDPCPEFEREILPRRRERFAARAKVLSGRPLSAGEEVALGARPYLFRVLFLAHCMREKGLFDALDGVDLANEILERQGSPARLHLTVAGQFVNAAERAEFEHRPGLASGRIAPTYVGFVQGESKRRVLAESDCFCFPTYYYAENSPLVLVEAMAFGLPILTTRWRSIPEMIPAGSPGLVDVHSPAQIAAALLRLMEHESGEAFRQAFLANFTLERHLAKLAEALRWVDSQP
jgi:glycosyltransferase involved in cell wall biosynthesis